MFNFLKRKANSGTENDRREPSNQFLSCYSLFEDVLENTLRIVEAYLHDSPNEWIHLFVSPGSLDDALLNSEDYIEFKLQFGTWYDRILYKHPAENDYLTSLFSFDDSENSFKYKIRIALTRLSYDEIKKIIHTCLDQFEREHPDAIKLSRTDFGVHNSWNL